MSFTNYGVKCGSLDINNLTTGEKIVSDTLAWVKFDVDEKLYLYTLPNELTPRPHAVITFSEGCFATICDSELTTMRGLQWFFRNLLLPNPSVNSTPQNPGTDQKDPQAPQAGVSDVNPLASGAFGIAAGAMDGASLNNFDYQPAAVYPIAGAIPMRSNIACYGPWASSNFSTTHIPDGGACGGITVENNPDLNPWNYGSTLALQGVGQTLVESTAIGLIKSETGSVTVPGLPLGVTTIGGAIGTFGPSLSSISFTYGGQGVSTSYEFKTYTPKFGKLTKLFTDKFKENVKKRAEFLRFIKNQSVNQYKSFRRVRAVQNQARLQGLRYKQAVSRQASLQRVLMGEMYNLYAPKNSGIGGPSQRTVVGTDTLDKSINEMVYDFHKKAFISLDGLYSPVSISGNIISPNPDNLDRGIFPRFIQAASNPSHFVSPLHPQPPFTTGECQDNPSVPGHDINNIKIHNMYLNPLSNPDSIPHVSGGSGHMGHTIDLVGRGTGIPESGLMSSLYPRDAADRYSNDYRFLGMKGPLVLHAWGYDVDGKPIPNFIDTEEKAKSGIFVTVNSGDPAKPSGLTEMFMADWLHKPATWPVGPVDLRFDRERGVWVSPQPYKIVVARVVEKVSAFGEGIGSIINKYESKTYGRDLYDGSGNLIKSSGCYGDDGCEYDNWVLSSIGTPSCAGADEVELVTCIALSGEALVATKTRIRIPGMINLGLVTPCSVSTTTCEPPPTTEPPTEPPTEEPEDPYDWWENCDDLDNPQFLRLDGSAPPFNIGTISEITDYGCFTFVGQTPGDDGTYQPPVSFTDAGTYESNTFYIFNSCNECLGIQDIFLENCCKDSTPQYAKIIAYDGEPESQIETGEVYYITGSPSISGCFTVTESGLCQDYTVITNPTFTSYADCSGCFETNEIECPSLSGNNAIIKLVDRIGNSHFVDDLVYAYYDTYRSEYIVLGSHESDIKIYGSVTLTGSSGTLVVEGVSVAESKTVKIGDSVTINNPLNFVIPSGCTVKGMATKFAQQS